MRSILTLLPLFLLAACAQRTEEQAQTSQRMVERWAGTVTMPPPPVDGEAQTAAFTLDRTQSSVTEQQSDRVATSKPDMEAVADMVAATGNWVGVAADVGGWALALLTGGAAIRSQVKGGRLNRAFGQTVNALHEVRQSLGEESWKAAIAPKLAEHQDADIKALVKAIEPRAWPQPPQCRAPQPPRSSTASSSNSG